MPVTLDIADFAEATIRLLDWGGFQRPVLGGPTQRINRLGDRYAVDFTLHEMPSDQEGRRLKQQLIRAKRDGARVTFPQDGLEIGSPGVAVVNGSGQSGSTLNVRGMTPNYVIRAGQVFHLDAAGRLYLHSADAQTIVSNTGTASIPISPMLRISPGDAAPVGFGRPIMEGNITSDLSWVYTPGRWAGMTVTIEEAE